MQLEASADTDLVQGPEQQQTGLQEAPRCSSRCQHERLSRVSFPRRRWMPGWRSRWSRRARWSATTGRTRVASARSQCGGRWRSSALIVAPIRSIGPVSQIPSMLGSARRVTGRRWRRGGARVAGRRARSLISGIWGRGIGALGRLRQEAGQRGGPERTRGQEQEAGGA